MKNIAIEIAFGNIEELNKAVNELLDKKLVAGCQVIEANSYWNWEDVRELSKEYLLFVKTKRSLVEDIYKVIKSIHSYECFEFAIFEMESPSVCYNKWIDEQTR